MSKKKTSKKTTSKASKVAKKAAKKPASKPTTKSAAKSAKKAASKKASVKKTAAKKAAKKPARKSSKKEPSKKSKAASDKASAAEATKEPAAEEILSKRTRKSTPAIFKIKSRRNTPILFTLEDVQQILEKKKQEGETEVPESKTTTVKQTKKSIDEASLPAKKSVHGAASVSDILGFNPKAIKEQKIADIEDSQVPAKWKKYYKELRAMREQLINGLDLHTKETLHRSSQDDSGNLSNYSQHMADAGTENFDRDFALSLVSSEQEALQEIEAAIRRIINDSYGVCEITGEPIKKERLMAVPFTRYSLEGQRQLERNRTRKNDRSTTFADFGSDESLSFSDDED